MKIDLSLCRAAFFFAVLTISLFILSTTSFAATFTVTNTNDSGAGSLRQAILDSNANTGVVDDIVFALGVTGIIPSDVAFSGEMEIKDDVTITGPGANLLTIDAQMNDRIFNINDSIMTDIVVSISGLRFKRGVRLIPPAPIPALYGGAILNKEELSIDSCVFEDNEAEGGGAIFNDFGGIITEITNCTFNGNNTIPFGGGAILNDGTITEITNSTFSGNSAEFGGAIMNDSGVIQNITDSTFSDNSADEDGGAIWNDSDIDNITNCTFSGNSAENDGGAIINLFGNSLMKNITNCTFSGNSAVNDGGAIWNGDEMNISFTTIANNEAGNEGGGIFEDRDPPDLIINIRNSIVAFNSSNCAGVISDEGNNYSNDASCGFGVGNNSTIELGPLADNGGPTETVALISGAPLDGASANCDPLGSDGTPTGVSIGIDQRFFPRPSGPACDSGAFEKQPVAIPPAQVPTLSEWSLMAMAGILGIVGFMVIRRRKVTA